MFADEVLTAQQVEDDREGWLTVRRTGVTASEIAAVLGLSPWESPFGLWHRKAGNLPDDFDNPRMALGRHLEAYVADQYADRNGSVLQRTGLYRSRVRPYQLATPDRLIMVEDEGLAPLECKTSSTFDGWGPDGSDEIPVYYRCQVLWQMDCLGLTEGYLTCLFLLTQEQRDYYLLAELEELELMRKAAQAFLARVHPPDVDWTNDTRYALQRLYPLDDGDEAVTVGRGLVRSYQAALRAYSVAEKRKKEMENRLRLAMGTAKRAVDAKTGDRVATRTVYERSEYMVSAGTVDRLTPARGRKA